ncbi:hypothetical protein W97_01171 [Coniosporium apollinis CBS 100218]|uniref:Ubiquitin-conjugating enzyme E2-binding protein n=1 Tax=Coniosporium apollinis (strain CBS 100218) TaxID=1168221 RepID=R7YJ95_CONA1|nr:uncharacterized protein W97_01171 [Coniosporium apollinis CBS 100218]EON61953.1 hypothetical protein W97_01171 [Coniosporium apollinis CBS 100218]
MTQISLYAEHLLNIHTVSLTATLQTLSNKETKASLSADGETISLTHAGETTTIRLPTKLSGGSDAALTLPAAPAKELTLRLQLKDTSPGRLRSGSFQGSENHVPWSAGALNGRHVRVYCASKGCGQELVKRGTVGDGGWKDLPNENWAEMMDFWHCHKPDHRHGHGARDGEGKGYAAANRLVARRGTGFVDLGGLLLKEEDCCVKRNTSDHERSKLQQLLCLGCGGLVGTIDDRVEGFKLWKWAVALSFGDEPPKQYSIQKWVSAQLLALVENEGVRKFVVGDASAEADGSKERLMLWVFTPDLSFSSSKEQETRNDPTRAMKILWKEAVEKAESSFSSEELALPSPIFGALRAALGGSAELLPASARKFQNWQVGLLERFGDDER